LPKPHESVVVDSITVKGVLFAFEGDEEREAELVKVPVVDDGLSIVEVGPDGLIMPETESSIGAVSKPTVFRPERTTLVRKDYYLIGTEDAQRFSDDYASMIAQIDHRRHRDPVTRQYDGIEIQSVPANSIAASHGVKSGDIIKSINGHPVTSSQEAIQFAKNNSEKYKVWEIVIENKGALRTVTYESPEE
jgi:membrane-associated protease RseP (regulator of RpoE activity)